MENHDKNARIMGKHVKSAKKMENHEKLCEYGKS